MSLREILMLLAVSLVSYSLTGCAHRGAHSAATAAPTIAGADLRHGKAVYEQQCAACHGEAGKGGEIGPSLANERAKHTYSGVKAIVGDPQPPMPKLYPSRMTEADVRDVSAYVESL
jgi:mono/diheme cytochrome c family protein